MYNQYLFHTENTVLHNLLKNWIKYVYGQF